MLDSEDEVTLRGVRLYPNPSSGIVMVDFTQTQQRVTKLVVYNSVGKQVLMHIPTSQRVSELDLSGFGAGMYLISIQAQDKQLTRKVVIR